jgi:hypothetical protein
MVGVSDAVQPRSRMGTGAGDRWLGPVRLRARTPQRQPAPLRALRGARMPGNLLPAAPRARQDVNNNVSQQARN